MPLLPAPADTAPPLSRRAYLQQVGRWAALGWAASAGTVGLAACQRQTLAASHPLHGVDLLDAQAQYLDSAALLGQRPVLLNCWAPWCPPCVKELPLLDRAWRQQQAEAEAVPFDMLALALDSADAVRRFWQQRDFALPLAVAGAAAMARLPRLGNLRGSLPYTVLLGPDGAILHSHLGAFKADSLALFMRVADEKAMQK